MVMNGGYWFNVGVTFSSNVGWFASSLYQCFLIPLALSVLALQKPSKTPKAIALSLLETVGVCFLGALLFGLVSPLFQNKMAVSVANHVLLLVLIAAYAALRSPLNPSARVVVASAMFMEINWALAIAHLLFLPILSLETANLLQLLVMLLGFGVVYIFRPAPSERTPVVYWLTMLLIAILSFVSLTVVRVLESIEYYDGKGSPALMILLPSFFVVSLLIYYLYYVLTREHHEAEKMAAMQMKQSRDVEFYDRTRALCGELHAMRHELKNHIAVMESMLRDGEYEKLEAYFSQVRGQSTTALEEFHCDNPLISSIINNAASTAGASGVHLDVVAAVPASLPIREADLCSMLSNLLDNSIEGCLAAGGDQIKASLHTEKGYLFITVTNPAPPDLMASNPQLTTTKHDTAAHGYGIPIIRRLADKYNGCVTFQMDNGFFVADVMLCLEEHDP
jgi:signal transduction histidine kinase